MDSRDINITVKSKVLPQNYTEYQAKISTVVMVGMHSLLSRPPLYVPEHVEFVNKRHEIKARI